MNDGIKTMTMTIPTPLDAEAISFKAEGRVGFDVSCQQICEK